MVRSGRRSEVPQTEWRKQQNRLSQFWRPEAREHRSVCGSFPSEAAAPLLALTWLRSSLSPGCLASSAFFGAWKHRSLCSRPCSLLLECVLFLTFFLFIKTPPCSWVTSSSLITTLFSNKVTFRGSGD